MSDSVMPEALVALVVSDVSDVSLVSDVFDVGVWRAGCKKA